MATQQAIMAGGCFWCTEAVMNDVVGVSAVESGYIGGDKPDPTYKEVCSGTTGHAEAVRGGRDVQRRAAVPDVGCQVDHLSTLCALNARPSFVALTICFITRASETLSRLPAAAVGLPSSPRSRPRGGSAWASQRGPPPCHFFLVPPSAATTAECTT